MNPSLVLRIAGLMLALGVATDTPAAINGTVQPVTFTGPVTGQPITFSIYLPPGYVGGTNRYPVIYHLHGINGTHNGGQISSVPESHEAAVAAGTIEPCIIVFPDGYGDSFWADSVSPCFAAFSRPPGVSGSA
jgi:enterochelin esterase-like enzyme